LKYWLLTTEYPPQFGGGIGTYCYQWCKALVEHKVDATVFLVNKNVKDFQEKWFDGVRVIEFSPYYEDCSSFLGYETMISVSFEKIVRVFIEKEGAPDWIESQEYNGIAYYILQKKHLGYKAYQDIKTVINCHCPSFIALEYNHASPYQLPHFWIGEMEKFCMKAADICISPSQYLIDIILERSPGVNRQFHILKNLLGTEGILPSANTDLSQEAVFLGKLSPIKGILELLKVFSNLWDNGYEYKLRLVGDEYHYYHGIASLMGPYIRKKYDKYIQKNLLVLAGSIKPEELTDCVSSAKVIILPSNFDNFPYTVLEMMARHKLILASDSGGHKEILRHNENALIFQSGNMNDLAEKIHQAFSLSEGAIRMMGEKASSAVKRFCDPALYFSDKMNVLKGHVSGETIHAEFPFLHVSESLPFTNSAAETFKKGLLSVVIPFYNLGNYVQETVDSIKASSYEDIELIIVDDGSSDAESVQKLEELRTQKDITIIRQQNAGLAEARNTGAKHAKGEFLAFLDADDKVSKDYYSFAIKIFREKRNVHFVGCWIQYFGESRNIWPSFTPEPPYLLFHNMVNSSGLIFRRDSFMRHGLNDPQFIFGMEDYDSVINLVKNNMGGVVIPELFFLYRVRKDSMARSFNKSNMTYLYQRLAEKHKLFYTTFAAEIASLLNANGPGYNYDNPTLDYHLYPATSLQGRIANKLILKIKRHPQLRKIALNFYKRLKLFFV
jgi:glycosyltransferase involved in cell wall biosynthesis